MGNDRVEGSRSDLSRGNSRRAFAVTSFARLFAATAATSVGVAACASAQTPAPAQASATASAAPSAEPSAAPSVMASAEPSAAPSAAPTPPPPPAEPPAPPVDPNARPRVQVGAMQLAGRGASADALRRTVRRNISQLTRCYEQATTTNRSLAGNVSMRFELSAAGRAGNVTFETTDPLRPVGVCMQEAYGRINFPRLTGARTLAVVSPLELDMFVPPPAPEPDEGGMRM